MIAALDSTTKELFCTVTPQMILDSISADHICALGDYTIKENGEINATGIIVFSAFQGRICILWHFVDEKYRGSGIGSNLLEAVTQDFKGEISIVFPVRYVSEEYFKTIKGYYEEAGFEEQLNSRLSDPDFLFISKDVASYPRLAGVASEKARPLSDLPVNWIRAALNSLLPEGFPAIGMVDKAFLDDKLSCAIASDEKITSALFAADSGGVITVFSLVNICDHSPSDLLNLLAHFMREVNSRYPTGTRIHIITSQRHRNQADAFHIIFPDAREYLPHKLLFKS